MSAETLPAYLEALSIAPIPSTSRLQALYASTSSQRLSNPTGYAANSTWWHNTLTDSLRSGHLNGSEGDRLILKLDDELIGKFEWNGRKPKGLAGFVEQMTASTPNVLYPMKEYMASLIPIHAPASLSSRFIGKPLYWIFSQINPFGGEKEVKEADLWKAYGKGREYVHVPLLQKAAERFKAHLEENPILNYSDALYDIDSFRNTFGSVCLPGSSKTSSSAATEKERDTGSLSKRDIEVLLKYLMRDENVLVTDGKIIKILELGQMETEDEITEVDKQIVSVLATLKRVETQIVMVEKQINQCTVKAKAHISSGQKQLAMGQLKSKKALEEILARRVGVEEQLRTVVRGIDEAQNDVEIVKAYQTSTSTLRTLLSNPLLNPDKVDQTTEGLAEALADQKEVDNAIQDGGRIAVGSSGVIDDDELAKELENMVEDEKKVKELERAKAVKEREEKAKEEKQKEEARRRQSELEMEEKRRIQAATAAAEKSKEDAAKIESRIKEVEEPTQIDTSTTQKASTAEVEAQKEWQRRYDEAQQREKEEKERAEVERLRRFERQAVAE